MFQLAKNIGCPAIFGGAVNALVAAVASRSRYVPIPTQDWVPSSLVGGIHGVVSGLSYDLLNHCDGRIAVFLGGRGWNKLAGKSQMIIKAMALALGTIVAVGVTPRAASVLLGRHITYRAAICFGLLNVATSWGGLWYSTRPAAVVSSKEEDPEE